MAAPLPTPETTGADNGIKRFMNWKVAVAGGALLGFGAASVIGATGGSTPLDTDPVGAVSLRESAASVRSLASPTSTTITVPSTTTTVAPAPPPPAPAPAPAPAPSVSVASPPRPAAAPAPRAAAPAPAPAPAPRPAQSWSAPSAASAASVASVASAASLDSP